MKTLSSILRLVAILCAAITVVVFFLGRNSLKEQEAQATALRQTLTAKEAELAATAEKLDAAEEGLDTERESLAAAKRNLESVRSEMLTARQELTRTREELSRAENEISELNEATAGLRRELVQRERDLTAATGTGEVNQLNERIAELEAELDRVGRELAAALKMKLGTPATTTAASSSGAGLTPTARKTPVQPGSIGQSTVIASVSRDAGILILQGGRELGLATGMEVTLVNNLKAVGKVRIGKVADTYTVANILPGTVTKNLSQGMTVSILR